MQLKDIMTRSVETIPVDASLTEAARKMEQKNIGFLPVVRDGIMVGVITDRDIAIRAVARGLDPEQTIVEEAMTNRIVALPEESELADASELMEHRRVRRLVVTANDGLAGVLSMDKLSLYVGRYGLASQGEFEGEANADTQEFAVGFDPAAMSGDGDDAPTSIGDDPSVTTEAEIAPRNARDQSDPRRGPRALLEKDGKQRS